MKLAGQNKQKYKKCVNRMLPSIPPVS